MAPKTFARRVLCLNGNNRSSCSERTRFDIWAHHPYTHGGPTHSAYRKNDASLGDLPEIQQILRAGRGHIAAPRRPQFWVTELSWDTNPPDKRGVPVRMHARWVSEALYRSWKAGVNVVIWTQLRDYAWPRFAYQGGLYYHGGIGGLSDRPKPGLYAFRFPFVAFKRSGGVYVWGRVPLGKPARLAIETKTRRGWTRVATARTNAHGVLEKTIRTRFQAGTFRARRVGRGAHSYQYKIGPTRDIPYAALGCGGPIAC